MTTEATHDFFTLTPDKILDSIEQFGVRCTGRVLQLNSMENRVYEVEIETDLTADKARHESFRVAKFYRPNRWTHEQILDEHGFLNDLVERDIPVVPPLEAPNGSTLLKMAGRDLSFALFPKSGGRIPQEFTDEEVERMGRLIARLHTIGSIRPAPSRLRLTPEVYGLKNLEYILASKLLPAEFTETYSSLVRTLCSQVTPWFQNVEMIRIHGDLHLANILWDENGPKLVDFDDMLTGPPIQDLWLIVPGRDEESLRQFQILLYGYKQLRTFDDTTLRLIEPLRAFRMIHFTAWIARRWEDPAFKRVFPNFGSHSYWAEQVGDLRDQFQYFRG